MKIIDLQQGSPEWLAHRRTVRNASDAPAMMGASPYVTRAELVRQRATGIDREIDAATQRVFDKGHAVEPALRALAERWIGEDLYPVTAVSDDGYLGASFDGVTLGEDVFIEAKQPNAEKMALVRQGILPPADEWQVAQQFAVCATADRCIYLCGDGTEEGTAILTVARTEMEHAIPKLRAGWAQLDADVAAYVPEPEVLPATGRAPETLPALHIEVTGMVTASNLAQWKEAAIAVFQGIGTDLQTDQDFADAEKTVKWCGDIEDQLKAAKAHALSQTASIDELFRTIDAISAEARAKRLELDKLVKARKESLRTEIVAGGCAAVRAHYDTINTTLGQYRIQPAQSLQLDIGAAIKGKKSISSMRDAVDAAAAAAKIEASQRAERIRVNMAIFDQHADHRHLFADAVVLAHAKDPDDLRNLVAARIAEHQQREAARLEAERERIRQEEAARLEREQQERERAQQNTAAGAAQAQQPLDDAAKNAGVATGSRDVSTSESVTLGSLPPSHHTGQPAANDVPAGARLTLGEINARIAPLTISSAGLAHLGFEPVAVERAAKLYNLADLPVMCEQMRRCLARAASLKEAA